MRRTRGALPRSNVVDAMVLSGCGINSSLTKNDKLRTKGGT